VPKYRCKICGREFDDLREAVKHLLEHEEAMEDLRERFEKLLRLLEKKLTK